MSREKKLKPFDQLSKKPPRDRPWGINFGGGTNSTALVIECFNRGFRPDWIVFGDTLGERPETYAALERLQAWLKERDFTPVSVTRWVRERPLEDGRTSESLEEYCLRTGYMPSAAYGYAGCSSKFKRQPAERWRKEHGFERTVYALGFDAGETRRVNRKKCDRTEGLLEEPWYPLYAWGITRAGCEEIIAKAGLPPVPKSACFYCLAGETEVVTRLGVKPIRELAGATHDLLVPLKGKLGGLSHAGAFKAARVESFGLQPLFEVALSRGRTKKVVRATAEHRWFVVPGSQWAPISSYERTTETLVPGDRLKPLSATTTAPHKERLMPVAVAQGFVFGDGSTAQDNRPASLCVYADSKDKALFPFFRGLGFNDEPRRVKANGRPGAGALIYGLPRFWKDLPPITESRSFLLSWLAGYFAADGSVSAGGQAVLYSSIYKNIEFARDVAAVCGVGYSSVSTKVRLGMGKSPTPIYGLGIQLRRLPGWFFIQKHHHERAEAKRTNRGPEQPWKVVSVRRLEDIEEVFCAVVPEAGAFGLAGDLMTGNCPYTKTPEWNDLRREHPDLFQRALAIEANAVAHDNAKSGLRRSQGFLRDLPVVGQDAEVDVSKGPACDCFEASDA